MITLASHNVVSIEDEGLMNCGCLRETAAANTITLSTPTCILLTTYNGSRFLAAQLESLTGQTETAWSLLARDDGSHDGSVAQLETFHEKYPEKIQIISDESHLGTAAGFSRLLEKSTAHYVFFCDQDDIWLPDKMNKTLAAMLAAEVQYGKDTPLLVHTDLRVVDEQLQALAPSFWKYQNLSPELGSHLHRLLPQNIVTGCTVMINRPLAERAAPIPEGAIMHDWWLVLVASLFGRVIHIDQPTILYRQHGNNSVGAKRWGLQLIVQRMQRPSDVRKSILDTMHQAQALLEKYHDQMTPAQCAMITAYACLRFMSKTERIKTIFKYRFFKHGTIRTLGFLTNLLMLNRFIR